MFSHSGSLTCILAQWRYMLGTCVQLQLQAITIFVGSSSGWVIPQSWCMWLDLILDCPFLAFLARNYFHWCNKSLLTLDARTSVSIFSLIFSICYFCYWQREFIWRSKLLRLVIISFILMILANNSTELL